MKEMKFTTDIRASRQKVWDVLWHDDTFREWAGIIDPGTYMVGDLEVGSEIQFISSENGYGVTSLVEDLVHGELLVLNHRADTQNTGASEREKEWTGGTEVYSLAQSGDITTLVVAIDVPVDMEDYFSVNYPKAVERIKQLAQQS